MHSHNRKAPAPRGHIIPFVPWHKGGQLERDGAGGWHGMPGVPRSMGPGLPKEVVTNLFGRVGED